MVDNTTPRATQEGATEQTPSAPSQAAVAGAGESTAPETTLDLSTLPQFREYDSKMQKKVADMERKLRDTEASAAVTRREAALAATRSNLQAEGLDEQAITKTIVPLQEELMALRFEKMRREMAEEFGLQMTEITSDDWGRSPDEGRANLARKRAQRDLQEAQKETERVRAEAESIRQGTERQTRKETGADKVASVGAAPPEDEVQILRAKMHDEMAGASGHEKLRIRHSYRIKHPEVAPYL